MENTLRLAEKIRPKLVSLIMRKFRVSYEDAEDIVQDGIVASVKHIDDSHGNPTAYLTAACRRKAIDHFKKTQRRVHVQSMTYVQEGESTVFDIAAIDPGLEEVESIDVLKATESLSPDQREAVVTWLYGEPDADAAARAGCCIATYKTRRFRGIKNLTQDQVFEAVPENVQYPATNPPRAVAPERAMSKRLRPAPFQRVSASYGRKGTMEASAIQSAYNRALMTGFYGLDVMKAVSGRNGLTMTAFDTTLVTEDGSKVGVSKTVRSLIEAGMVVRTKDESHPLKLTKQGEDVVEFAKQKEHAP